jgi:hypothetical protein
VTQAGANSSQFCEPKRKKLGVPGWRSIRGTHLTAARRVGTHRSRIALAKRSFVAGAHEHAARNILRAGLALHARTA